MSRIHVSDDDDPTAFTEAEKRVRALRLVREMEHPQELFICDDTKVHSVGSLLCVLLIIMIVTA